MGHFTTEEFDSPLNCLGPGRPLFSRPFWGSYCQCHAEVDGADIAGAQLHCLLPLSRNSREFRESRPGGGRGGRQQ
eukprot:1212635-Pyramimonas_sp.AAC.1